MATPSDEKRSQGEANRRTGVVLLSIALVFFGGIILAQFTGGTTVGITVLGFGVIGFLLVAIGRNIRDGERK